MQLLCEVDQYITQLATQDTWYCLAAELAKLRAIVCCKRQ